jgi:hypothetical protein
VEADGNGSAPWAVSLSVYPLGICPVEIVAGRLMAAALQHFSVAMRARDISARPVRPDSAALPGFGLSNVQTTAGQIGLASRY